MLKRKSIPQGSPGLTPPRRRSPAKKPEGSNVDWEMTPETIGLTRAALGKQDKSFISASSSELLSCEHEFWQQAPHGTDER